MKEDKLKPSSVNTSDGKKEEKPKNEIEEVKKQLIECQKLKDEYLNGWKRERADFLNYKKEEMERICELMKYANEELILKMLPILDNFEAASKNITEKLKSDDNPEGKPSASYGASIEGFLQIKQQMENFLKTQGVEEINTMGDPPTARQGKFDPQFHEVVGEVEEKGKEPGIIIEKIQKGYTLHGKVIRPAKVKISK